MVNNNNGIDFKIGCEESLEIIKLIYVLMQHFVLRMRDVQIYILSSWRVTRRISLSKSIDFDVIVICVMSGFIADYISHPVLESFTTAAVVTIAFGQVKVSAVVKLKLRIMRTDNLCWIFTIDKLNNILYNIYHLILWKYLVFVRCLICRIGWDWKEFHGSSLNKSTGLSRKYRRPGEC